MIVSPSLLHKVHKAKTFLLKLLPRAGQIAKSYFYQKTIVIRQKGRYDLVNQADLALDQFLSEALLREFPDIPILSEETVRGNIEDFKKESLVWLIDPLDGSINFSRKDPNFSISVALVAKGKSVLGAVSTPLQDKLFWASIFEEGAFLNGKKIKTSQIDNLSQAVISTEWSYFLPNRDKTKNCLQEISDKILQFKILGSATTSMTLVSQGITDVYFHSGLFPWDHAAAGLIAQKAGAMVTNLTGKSWQPFDRDILMANIKLYSKIKKFLLK